jgi:hypothetical protein
MKPKSNFNSSFTVHRLKFYFLFMGLLCCFFCVNAQVKKPTPVKPVTAIKPVTAVKPATTPAKPATTIKAPQKSLLIVGVVQHLTVKLPALGDPAYENTTKHAKRKAVHSTGFDDTAKTKSNGINVKFVKNPKFGAYSPTTYKATTKKGSAKTEKSTDKTGAEWDCSSSTVALTANSANFLSADPASTAGLIYPGAFYTFDNFFSGNQKPVAGKQHVLSLVIDNANLKSNDNPTINISNPSYGTVYTGVDKLKNELTGPVGNYSFNSTSYETSNSTAASLQVSGGGSYAGVSVSASYSTSSQSNTVNVTIDATKILYTIRVSPSDSGYFVDPNIENTKNLMVMGRVSYGVRVLANFTYTMNSSQDAETFKASYSGFGASANVDLNAVSADKNVSSTINCYAIGGPGNIAPQFDKKDLEKEIQNVFKGATWKNAQPISYSFYDMADDVIGSYSNTDDFNERNCVPNTSAAKLESAYITYTTSNLPGENKDDDTHYNVFVYGGWNQGTRNNFNGYDGYPQTANNGEPFLLAYKTGPLNVTFNSGTSHQDQMTPNNYLSYVVNETAKGNVTMDYFVKQGGLVHFHIYPNGHDTWGINKVVLTMNFAGGLSQSVTWGGNGPDVLVLTQDSTEGTLYFDGTFKPRQ